MASTQDKMQKIISLCKRRGFVYQDSEIYGGLANSYDFGPLGVELLRNITNNWWDFFVTKRGNTYGMESTIIMNPKVWEASGHTQRFNDALIDCKNCRNRTRADHLLENSNVVGNAEGLDFEEMDKLISENKIKCPVCGKADWTKARKFNLLFETSIGILEESSAKAYLRGELAQGMFVNFKNVIESMRPRLPFGIAQVGKAFRNEITKGNFIFRNLEFQLAEFEFFFDPKTNKWEEIYDYWKVEMKKWIIGLGVSEDHLSFRVHSDKERSHYSEMTEDLDYEFPFGKKEMFGLAYRTDFDLKNHMERSGADLRYTDPNDPTNKFIPHVIEPTFGINRVFLAIMCEAYEEEGDRVVLKLNPSLAPYKVAVFPLVSNKEDIVAKAQQICEDLSKEFPTVLDARGNIGKRYYSQDEIGTPFCVTIDYQTLEDDTVTVRFRDSMKQERVSIPSLQAFIANSLVPNL